jgi:hypothetical protein
MKRSLDIDNSKRTGPIIRTRFITPFKIVLLYLIYEFCGFQMFPHRIIPQAVIYLVEQVLVKKTIAKYRKRILPLTNLQPLYVSCLAKPKCRQGTFASRHL